MDAPAPRPEPTPASQVPARQRALTALICGAVVWLVVHAALHGSLTLRRDPPAPPEPARLDLNHATLAELELLPGVGPQLARRIDAYRTLYGPYPHVDELRKVPGIGPLTLERLRPHVIVNGAAQEHRQERGQLAFGVDVPPIAAAAREPVAEPAQVPADAAAAALVIDPNRATAAELDQLPGIGPKLAQRIIQARAEQPFASVDDLRRVPGIGAKTLDKLRPHIQVTP